jgi:mannose-6-phosphate isomerase-like protein (cupin superfamily)
MHPVLPLPVEVAWCDVNRQFWDSRGGVNYRYEFNMALRGWDHFLAAGARAYPYGGLGVAHYRTLFSNDAPHGGMQELGRLVPTVAPEVDGASSSDGVWENSLSVDTVELVVLKSDSGIGLHRHRDNQEGFLLLGGQGLMVVGDWCQMPTRERCFEVRPLRPGHLVLLEPGQLHGLLNTGEGDLSLFAFGSYD